jgi:hypothetical protein
MHRLILGVMNMKRFFLGIATLLALTFSVASSALTLEDFTGTPADSIYNDTGAQYVHVTDVTPLQTVPMLDLSTSGLGAGVSPYSPDYIIGIFDPNSGITLNVLDTAASISSNQLTFTATSVTESHGGTTANIGNTFGFFIEFHPVGGGATSTYYSNGSPDLFSIFHDPDGITSLGPSTEVVLGIGGTGEGPDGHALIMVRDVAAVPVPAAVWLFGSAMIGLLGLGRRQLRESA